MRVSCPSLLHTFSLDLPSLVMPGFNWYESGFAHRLSGWLSIVAEFELHGLVLVSWTDSMFWRFWGFVPIWPNEGSCKSLKQSFHGRLMLREITCIHPAISFSGG